MREALSRPVELPDLSFARSWPWVRITRIGATAFLALPLLILALASLWDRPIQDDFDYALSAWRHGVIGAAVDSWHSWGGRFTAVVAEGATANAVGYRLVPGLLLALMAGGWALAARALNLSWRRAVACGVLLTAGAILVCPDLQEPLFWRCAATGYFLPVALSGWVVAAALSRRRELLPLAAIVAFISAGCAEVWSLILVAALLVACIVWRRQGVALALGGAVIGSALLFLAPGNAKRAAQVPHHPTLMAAIHTTMKYTARFFSPSWVVTVWPMICLLLALGILAALLLGDQVRFKVKGWALLVVGAALPPLLFAAVWLCNFPPVYALGDEPAPRTLIIPAFLCATAAIAYGAMLGRWLQDTRYRAALPWLALWAVYQLSAITPDMPLAHLHRLQTFAAGMDARETYIKQEKARGYFDLTVPPVYDQHDIGANATFWVNTEAARYYGLHTIRIGAR